MWPDSPTQHSKSRTGILPLEWAEGKSTVICSRGLMELATACSSLMVLSSWGFPLSSSSHSLEYTMVLVEGSHLRPGGDGLCPPIWSSTYRLYSRQSSSLRSVSWRAAAAMAPSGSCPCSCCCSFTSMLLSLRLAIRSRNFTSQSSITTLATAPEALFPMGPPPFWRCVSLLKS